MKAGIFVCFVHCSLDIHEECQAYERYLISTCWVYEWFLNIRLCCLNYANTFYTAPHCVRRISSYSSLYIENFTQTLGLPPQKGLEERSLLGFQHSSLMLFSSRTLNSGVRNKFYDSTAWREWGGGHSCKWLGTVSPESWCGLTFEVLPNTRAEPCPWRDAAQPLPAPWTLPSHSG